MTVASPTLELGKTGGMSVQTVGIRFADIGIPREAVITRAYIMFDTAGTCADDSATLYIRVEASDSAEPFSAVPGDIQNRPVTDSSVRWGKMPFWNAGDTGIVTPDISPVIQEVVSRDGWAAGNALAVLVSGTGRRTGVSYEGDPARAPLLHIEYSTGADTVPPTVPQNLTAEEIPVISGYQVSLSWDASSDNIAVAGYDVFCGDIGLTGTPADTSYIHDTESPGDCAYTVEAYDAAGNRSGKSGPVSVTPGNTAPSVTVSAEPGTENHTFIIRWSDDDPDDSAQISLYYDTDSAGNDGTLIVSGLEEDDETDEHAWDTAGVPAGEYHVYAIIDDSANDPVTAYSTGTVTITNDSGEINGEVMLDSPTPVEVLSYLSKIASWDDNGDEDSDGLTNRFEISTLGLRILPDIADTDNDGISDADEDADSDGLKNIEEQTHGTNPTQADSDRDGIDDKDELAAGTDSLSGDTDNDGLDDGDEYVTETDPLNPDTDGDGIPDADEIFTTLVSKKGITVAVTGKGNAAAFVTVSVYLLCDFKHISHVSMVSCCYVYGE